MAKIEVLECDSKPNKIGRFSGTGNGRAKNWGDATDMAHEAAIDDIIDNELPEIRCMCGVTPVLTWTLVERVRSNEATHILVLGKDVKATEYSLTLKETYDIEASCTRRKVLPKGRG